MKIIDAIAPDRQFLSLEFFPPKERTEWPAFFRTADQLARLAPLFASVTYGAGGSTHGETLGGGLVDEGQLGKLSAALGGEFTLAGSLPPLNAGSSRALRS